MALIPDPRTLDLTAARLEQHADQLRSRASHLAVSTQSTRWASHAATAFAGRSNEVSLDLTRCANRIDDASRELRAHANTVRNRIAEIQRAAQLAEQAAKALLTEPVHVGGKIFGALADVLGP